MPQNSGHQRPGQFLQVADGARTALSGACAETPGNSRTRLTALLRDLARPQRDVLAQRAAGAIVLAGLGLLVWFAFHLGAMRAFHLDESRNVFAARALAVRNPMAVPGNVDLFQLALSLVARGASRSIEIFTSCRFVMIEVLWLNIFLIALATGKRLLSLPGLAALAGAATLAPLWDYGFEIRQDNLFLTGILLIWCSIRAGRAGAQNYFMAGALLLALQLVTVKAFIFTVPISVALLAFPPAGQMVSSRKRFAAYACGAAVVFAAIAVLRHYAGLPRLPFPGLDVVTTVSADGSQVGPVVVLGRMLSQTPLLLAVSLAAFIALARAFLRDGKRVLSWESSFPELLLVACGIATLVIFPAPCDLLHVVPYVFLLAFRYISTAARELEGRPALFPAVAAMILFAHLVPFSIATLRHLDHSNARQEGVMRLGENLTDPAKDSVCDATGIIATRTALPPQALLGCLTNESTGNTFCELLRTNPMPVFVPSVIMDALGDANRAFVREHYVALADDLWVLGKTLPPGGGAFEVIYPGRYRISSLEGSDLTGTYPEGYQGMVTPEAKGSVSGLVDGAPISEAPIVLTAGVHRLECSSNCLTAVVWMGPRLDRIHRAGPGDHKQLFVSGY